MRNYLVAGTSSGTGKEIVSLLKRKGLAYGTYRNTPLHMSETGVECKGKA